MSETSGLQGLSKQPLTHMIDLGAWRALTHSRVPPPKKMYELIIFLLVLHSRFAGRSCRQ